MCVSSRVIDSKDSTSMLNAAAEHVDSSSEQVELVGVDRRKLEICDNGGCIDDWCLPAKK